MAGPRSLKHWRSRPELREPRHSVRNMRCRCTSGPLESDIAAFTEDVPTPTAGQQSKNKAAGMLQKLNPFWIRIPFGRPDDLLQTLRPFIGWLFCPLVTMLGVCLMLAAACRLMMDWQQFETRLRFCVLSRQLAVDFDSLDDAEACSRNRSRNRVSAVWRQRSRNRHDSGVLRHRWPTWMSPAVGVLRHAGSEFMWLWRECLSNCCWHRWLCSHGRTSRPDVASHLLYNIIVMASVSTLLFNAKPADEIRRILHSVRPVTDSESVHSVVDSGSATAATDAVRPVTIRADRFRTTALDPEMLRNSGRCMATVDLPDDADCRFCTVPRSGRGAGNCRHGGMVRTAALERCSVSHPTGSDGSVATGSRSGGGHGVCSVDPRNSVSGSRFRFPRRLPELSVCRKVAAFTRP